MAIMTADLSSLARHARAWPFEEARKLAERMEKSGKDTALFETGYGPSGLPHIGTFGEVARTTMVRHAYSVLTGADSRLVCFSDDMDGLRKVPDNVPNQELLARHLKKPLTQVPDPFGTHASFGAHNNARLQSFLDRFGFEYTFKSATEAYGSGEFDDALKSVLRHYDKVMEVILPTLGPERRATYSPVLPICPRTGIVLEVPLTAWDADAGTVGYSDAETGEAMSVPVTGGHCKLQWKADWAMRWVALGVDYEMAGKDLIDSVKLSGRIARILGANPPEGFNYELFLDEKGEKISKSKGNGLTIEEWLRYASPESLSLFMFQQPRRAKRLYFDVIPRAVEDYYAFRRNFAGEEPEKKVENPAWHVHSGPPPADVPPVSFSMLLNLVSASNSEDRDILWGFIGNYAPGTTPETAPELDRLVDYAIAYFHDFVKPAKSFRAPDARERKALAELADALAALPAGSDGETIQNEVYRIGRDNGFEPLRDWFKAIYQVLFGQEQGPRFGSFVAIYGLEPTREMIDRALNAEFAS